MPYTLNKAFEFGKALFEDSGFKFRTVVQEWDTQHSLSHKRMLQSSVELSIIRCESQIRGLEYEVDHYLNEHIGNGHHARNAFPRE